MVLQIERSNPEEEVPSAEEEEETPSGQEEEEEDEDEEEEEESTEEEEVPEEPKEKPRTKFDLLHDFIQQTDNFLNRFDDVVENKNAHRTLFLAHMSPMRETLVSLLLRFIQNELPRDDYLYQHIVCCAEAHLNKEDFADHYAEVHRESDKDVSLPEIDIIDEFHQACHDYIAEGKVVNVDLLFKLRRLLRKSNTVLADPVGVIPNYVPPSKVVAEEDAEGDGAKPAA